MKNKLLSSALVALTFGCASGDGGSGAKNAENPGSGNPTAAAKAPSALNPQLPPRVTVKGIGEGELLLNNSATLEIAVQNYPMENGWQEAVVLLNRVPVERFADVQKSLTLRSSQLIEGLNQVVVYLQRSWGESIKGENASATLHFFYSKKDASAAKNIGPGIVITAPRGTYGGEAGKKVMFDFFVVNGGGRKLKVYYSIAGELRELAAEGAPFYFYNLPAGHHRLKVDLVDARGKPVGAAFSSNESEFKIE